MKKELYDLTNPQKSIWLTEQFYPNTNIANVCGTLFLEDVLDFKLLEKSINLFIKQNDGLRIKIEVENNIPKQYVSDYEFCEISILNVNDKEELSSVIDSIVSRPIFALNSPLCKFYMFKFTNGTGGFIALGDHMIADAWATSLIVTNITKIYLNLIKNINSDASYPSYIEYIDAEKKYLSSEKYLIDQNYWQAKYSEMPEIASFCNLPISEYSVSKAERETFVISKELSAKISVFCKENKISVFTFLLLIYSIYLGRISKADIVNVGTPILNRTNFSEKNCIGMFVNTLPFQVNLSNTTSFIDCANKLAIDELTVLRHQKYPYIELLRYLRDKFHTEKGLYDFVFSYQNAQNKIDDSEIKYHTEWNFNHTIPESLNVHVSDLDNTNSLNIYYDYQISKLSHEEIVLIHNRILNLINQVLLNPNQTISNLEITTENEINEIIHKFNNSNATYPVGKTIVDLFENQVIETPNNVAVKIDNEFLTYSDLNKKANQFANKLRKLGVNTNVPVAIRLNKSINMIVAILGIIKAGGCYVPINLSYPKERIDFMLKDSSCKFFITNSEHFNDIEVDSSVSLINIDDNDYLIELDCNLEHINSPEDTLYIIYTSGSTGIPKGVLISHLNVVRLLKNSEFQFDFNSNDVWTMFHSVAFDFSVWEMYGALLYGGKLVLISENTAKDPFLFLELLRKENVTVLNQTPSYFYNLQDLELLQQYSDLSIRYIIFGGEALKPSLIKPWKCKYPTTKLINMYGITETTVHVTFRELLLSDLDSDDSIIGTPIPTLKVYIMDNNQKIMPLGIEGEICVAGLGVCKGYLNRPELNKTKFVPNPYVEGELLYRSADSGYLDRNLILHYIGRIDNQVKIRGFRVELGEIETKLLSYPSISKCVVLPISKDNNDISLIAYIVEDKNTPITKLKEYMQKMVPSYMVPNYFVKLNSLPLNVNGKVDRKKLKTIPINNEREIPYVKPITEFEKILVDTIEKSLNISNLGINDDIINLGVDSLSLMKIAISLLEKGISVNIQSFYSDRTIKRIEENLNTKPQINTYTQHVYNNFDESFSNKNLNLNNILLTGSTGFLGAHILNDLINNTDSNIYCLIRDKYNIDGKTRLLNTLNSYFGNSLDKYVDNRIKVVNGDISKDSLGLSDFDYKMLSSNIDLIIHSAAIVSHYGSSEIFSKINVTGTKNIIDFCLANNIYLSYISTLSLSGLFANSAINESFTEHSIYIGQDCFSNVYINSKFEAEIAINNALKNGLKVVVFRLGNITARSTDFVFQENYSENAFLNRLLSLIKLEIFPKSLLNFKFDLSPVDSCSNKIVALSKYFDSYGKIFHIANNNTLSFAQILEWLKEYGYVINILEDNEFIQKISNYENKDDLMGIINDLNNNILEDKNYIDVDSTYSLNVLNNHDMYWIKPSKEYFYNFINKYLNKENN